MSRYKQGEILSAKERVFGTAVWNIDDLNDVVDSVEHHDILITVKPEDNYGWVRILTPNGKIGIVHRSNLTKPGKPL